MLGEARTAQTKVPFPAAGSSGHYVLRLCVQQVHRHTFAERLARAERFARSWGEPVSQPVPAVVGKQSTVLNSMTEATLGPGPQRSCHAEPHRTRGSRTQDSRSRQAGRTGSCSLQDGSSYVSSPPPPQLLRLLLILAPWLFLPVECEEHCALFLASLMMNPSQCVTCISSSSPHTDPVMGESLRVSIPRTSTVQQAVCDNSPCHY